MNRQNQGDTSTTRHGLITPGASRQNTSESKEANEAVDPKLPPSQILPDLPTEEPLGLGTERDDKPLTQLPQAGGSVPKQIDGPRKPSWEDYLKYVEQQNSLATIQHHAQPQPEAEPQYRATEQANKVEAASPPPEQVQTRLNGHRYGTVYVEGSDAEILQGNVGFDEMNDKNHDFGCIRVRPGTSNDKHQPKIMQGNQTIEAFGVWWNGQSNKPFHRPGPQKRR